MRTSVNVFFARENRARAVAFQNRWSVTGEEGALARHAFFFIILIFGFNLIN